MREDLVKNYVEGLLEDDLIGLIQRYFFGPDAGASEEARLELIELYTEGADDLDKMTPEQKAEYAKDGLADNCHDMGEEEARESYLPPYNDPWWKTVLPEEPVKPNFVIVPVEDEPPTVSVAFLKSIANRVVETEGIPEWKDLHITSNERCRHLLHALALRKALDQELHNNRVLRERIDDLAKELSVKRTAKVSFRRGDDVLTISVEYEGDKVLEIAADDGRSVPGSYLSLELSKDTTRQEVAESLLALARELHRGVK